MGPCQNSRCQSVRLALWETSAQLSAWGVGNDNQKFGRRKADKHQKNPLGFHCVKSGENRGLSLGQSGVVPGTNPVCPWNNPGVFPRATRPKSLCLCAFFQKEILVSVEFSVRNSGAGNGCANFMGTWKNCVLSAGKTHVHKIPRFRGGGYFGFFLGGEVRILFLWARGFF